VTADYEKMLALEEFRAKKYKAEAHLLTVERDALYHDLAEVSTDFEKMRVVVQEILDLPDSYVMIEDGEGARYESIVTILPDELMEELRKAYCGRGE
jgi:hypothetical protein